MLPQAWTGKFVHVRLQTCGVRAHYQPVREPAHPEAMENKQLLSACQNNSSSSSSSNNNSSSNSSSNNNNYNSYNQTFAVLPHAPTALQLMINGKHIELPSDPHKLVLPTSGSVDLCFVDLRPVVTPEPPPQLYPPLSPHPAAPEVPAQDPPPQAHPARGPGPRFCFAIPSVAAPAHRAAPAAAVATGGGSPAAPKAPMMHDGSVTDGKGPVRREPVLLTQPTLLSKAQMDALVAALQFWPSLDPIKVRPPSRQARPGTRSLNSRNNRFKCFPITAWHVAVPSSMAQLLLPWAGWSQGRAWWQRCWSPACASTALAVPPRHSWNKHANSQRAAALMCCPN